MCRRTDGPGNQLNVVDGDVSRTPFQGTNECSVQTRFVCHALLRHADVNPHQSDVASKHQAEGKWGRDTRHAFDARKKRCLKPRCLKPFNIRQAQLAAEGASRVSTAATFEKKGDANASISRQLGLWIAFRGKTDRLSCLEQGGGIHNLQEAGNASLLRLNHEYPLH